ncbi:MAG TPA: NAD(P)/FAD-dependent oxidoreductase [Polyangia bacterium]|jgi:2-polyprenyl-6-methoxyphenol hydroxylase-like FAD-dependent oxidoreductase
MMTSDVLIAGGGPAGAALAIHAGRAGLPVSLFDGARFPRDKACGEGLMPSGVGALQRLGLAGATGGVPIGGIRYRGFGLLAETAFPPPRREGAGEGGGPAAHGLGQRRIVFDEALWAAARATPNVRVFEGAPVEGVVMSAGRAVGLRVAGQTVRGGLIVGADGARSFVRRAVGLEAPRVAHPRWGLRMHFRLAPDRPPPTFVEVFVGPGHELYLTPLPAGEVLVAVLSEHGGHQDSPVQTLRAFIDQHPALVAHLRGAEPVSSPRGRSPLASVARAGVAPGVVLLGDAAGFTDPLTGGGMAQALLSAELLAPFLRRALTERDDEWLWRFDRRRRALLRDYVLLTGFMVQMARRPRLARATLQAMRASPAMMRHLVGVAAGLRRITF